MQSLLLPHLLQTLPAAKRSVPGGATSSRMIIQSNSGDGMLELRGRDRLM
jgi:hypothetical protein